MKGLPRCSNVSAWYISLLTPKRCPSYLLSEHAAGGC